VTRKHVEDALAAWREAVRRRDAAMDGDIETLEAEVLRTRNVFHQVSAEHMMERIDALKDAEQRRRSAVPSTDSFHQAARDEKDIAAEIWDEARLSDEDIPRN
jgi:hypothetical protein